MKDFIYHKRDISWLSFNERVLQEAKDPSVPLYEQIKFLAIYSSNLDEFYRVRVSALRRFKEIDKVERKNLMDIKPKRELRDIKRIVRQQQTEFGRIFRTEILPALRKVNIHLYNRPDLFSPEQKAFAQLFFQEQVLPKLNPQQLLESGEDVPFLLNQALYLICTFSNTDQLGMVNIPTGSLPRFVLLPQQKEQHAIAFLDDIIRLNAQKLFKNPIKAIYAIKVSRDAELYIDDEFDGDLLEKIKSSLDQRNTGLPTRMLYDTEMPIEVTLKLKQIFQLKKNDLFPGGRYHNFSDFFGLPNPSERKDLHDQEMPPLPHPVLEKAASLMQAIETKDQILHFPYQRYHYIEQLIQEAANHPDVQSIKITLYRVAAKSKVVQALLDALRKGKKVVAFIEAKARFDEASNIFWGKELEEAGATVLYSYPAIKVHTKLLLIAANPESGQKDLVYIGTGNFNEKTAKLYGDHALLSARKALAKDVHQVFGVLERKLLVPKPKKLFISPFNTRSNFEDLIDREINFAKAGKKAYLLLKMNSLEDPDMVAKLYEANNAGVQITLLVRGICTLVAGIQGQSENIQVLSLVDRFLEHARVYIFGNDGQEEMFIASADWMTRNLDRRIEVVAPIKDPDVYEEIRTILDLQLKDTTKLRRINDTLENPSVKTSEGAPKVNAQSAIYAYLAAKIDFEEPGK